MSFFLTSTDAELEFEPETNCTVLPAMMHVRDCVHGFASALALSAVDYFSLPWMQEPIAFALDQAPTFASKVLEAIVGESDDAGDGESDSDAV